MLFDVIVFDTAPTGHTLRLLNFPDLLEKGMEKLISLKLKFTNLFDKFAFLFGSQEQLESTFEKIFGKLETMKKTVEKVGA
jgi:arsenite-transporting ATPase